MANTNNNVITAITLMERITPMLHAQDRAPISARHLKLIQNRLVMVLELINKDVQTPLVLVPIGEVIKLVDTLQTENNFVETSSELKDVICESLFSALDQLYLFAGKFYEEHEFDYNIGLDRILQKIVDANIQHGYYFGLEVN